MKLSFKDTKLLLICSAILFLSTVVMFFIETETDRPWKGIQRDFVKIDKELTEKELADAEKLEAGPQKQERLDLLNKRTEGLDNFTPTIKQVWLPHFDTADRCMSCHLGSELDRFKDAELPFKAHPGNHLDPSRHSVDAFGCVVCHEGQGVGLTVEEAHGHNHHNWMTPLLAGHRAESSCEGCHPMRSEVAKDAVMEDAPAYSRGRTIYLENNCLGCHVAKGFRREEGIGPVLTTIGTKTDSSWSMDWIKKPKGYLANTLMPDFELDNEAISAMTAYLFSLSKPLSADSTARAELDNPEAVKRGEMLLTDLGCLGCHSVDGKDEG
ncbi:MAG: cytochrome c, partial [Thermodesulfobacteriota bacterium]